MLSERIARRYVKALFGLAADQGVADEIAACLHELQQIYRLHTKLRNTLAHPRLPLEKKRTVLLQIMGPDTPPLLQRFVTLLLEKRRVGVLDTAGTIFARLQDEAAGIRHAQVRTPLPLSEEQQFRLQDVLSRVLGWQIVLTTLIDPDVVGGVSVKVGDLLLDGSIRSRLRGLLEELRRTQVAVH